MYTPFSIKWLDQQTQTSQRWQMGSISLYMFCPLKSPKRTVSAFGGTLCLGRRKSGKKMEKRRVPESSQMHTDAQFHTYLPLGYSEMSKDASRQSLPHMENILHELAAVSGSCTTDRIPGTVGPLKLVNSHRKQGPPDASSPPTVTGTPPAMSPSHADIISFWKGHLLHLEGTKGLATFRGEFCCQKVQLWSIRGERQKILSITNIYFKKNACMELHLYLQLFFMGSDGSISVKPHAGAVARRCRHFPSVNEVTVFMTQ